VELNLEQVLRELRRRKKGLAYDELRRLLQMAGCRIRDTKDGFLVSHPHVRGYMPTVAKPHGRAAGNVVRPVYAGKCIRLIELAIEAKGEPGGENIAGA
jgi:hypothetical protein